MLTLQAHDTILFQGDSITHAFRLPAERSTSSQLGTGWVTLLAAEIQGGYPEMDVTVLNRGECGHGVRELLARWETDCLALAPTVLNLLVGVNDTIGTFRWNRPCSLDLFESVYRELLDQTIKRLPSIRLVLCEPFLLEVDQVTRAWRDDLSGRQDVVSRLAAEYGACFVPLQAAIDQAAAETGPAYWLFDGIHPNAAGQWLIRKQWRSVVLGWNG